jgi:hypothetical protein
LYWTTGNGKNTLFKLFGEAIGGFVAVGNDNMESQFNEWVLKAVILLDEFISESRDTRKLKSKLKSLINGEQTINRKHEKLFTCQVNGYIAIASNEHVTCSPVIIEDGDRRYSIIYNDKSMDLAKIPAYSYEKLCQQLPDFIHYLASRPIDIEKANRPLESDRKQLLREMAEDEKVVVVREWVAAHRGTPQDVAKQQEICASINDSGVLRVRLTAQKLRPIMEHLGHKPFLKDNQFCYKGLLVLTLAEWVQGGITDSGKATDDKMDVVWDSDTPSTECGGGNGENTRQNSPSTPEQNARPSTGTSQSNPQEDEPGVPEPMGKDETDSRSGIF